MPSSQDATRRWLLDIRHHIVLAQRFVEDVDYEAFKDDLMRLYAVVRCLEIISEASRRVPADLKGRHPSIAWQQMAGAGNVYRHEYEDVAARRVWQALIGSLPPLLVVVESELAQFDSRT